MTLNKRGNETPILQYPPDEIGDGSATVATAGTRVQLSTTSIPSKRILVTASKDNSGDVYVGGETVATGRGKLLVPLQDVWLDLDNVNKVYVDAETSADKVEYLYVV
jgi:hypothetical protein